MKKIIFGAIIFVFVIILGFYFYSRFDFTEKDTYTIDGFTCDSLSKITGKKENVSSRGSGGFIGGKYFYVIFSFNNDSERDSAASKYVLYLKDTLGFLDLPEGYKYNIGSSPGYKHFILVQFCNTVDDKPFHIGVDNNRYNTLEIIILANPSW